MKTQRRSFLVSLAALGAALAFALPAAAQTPGKDYTPVTPVQPTDNPAKIEVIEFFSYGCPHCYEFNPELHAWTTKLPADVAFRKVPVTFGRAAWVSLAKLYYTLEATGNVDKFDAEVFKGVHVDHASLFEDKGVMEWAAKKGLDAKKFADTYNSFSIASKVRRGDQMAQAYRIQGVPALAVDGKFLVGGQDHAETLSIANQLIAKARAEKGKK